MTRQKTPVKTKKKIIKALEKGATEPQLKKHVTEWAIYHVITKQEREEAKKKHGVIIDKIFK